MGRYRTAKETAFVSHHLGEERLSIIDIGGGSGRFALPLGDLGHRVTVVDISPEAIDILRRSNHPRIETHCGDLLGFDASVRFDAAIAIESVQYMTALPLVDVFRKIASLIRPAAPFILTGLNKRSWRHGLHLLRRSRPPYRTASPAEFLGALRMAGFNPIDIEGFMWTPLPNRSNSRLVPAIAAVERGLRLFRWVNQSPWLLIASRRE